MPKAAVKRQNLQLPSLRQWPLRLPIADSSCGRTGRRWPSRNALPVDRLPAPLPGRATILIDAALVDIAENNSLRARPAAVAGGREIFRCADAACARSAAPPGHAKRGGEHESPADAPYRLDQRSLQPGHRDRLRDRPVLSRRAAGSQFQLPDRPQHQCGVRFHPGHAVLRALDPHPPLVRERHAAAGRRHHHQRRSGDQLGRQGREPRRTRCGSSPTMPT